MPRLPPEGSLTAGLPTHCYVGNTSSGPIHSDDNDKGKNPAPTPEDSRSVRQYRNLAPPGLEPVGHLNSIKPNQRKSKEKNFHQRTLFAGLSFAPIVAGPGEEGRPIPKGSEGANKGAS